MNTLYIMLSRSRYAKKILF